MALIHRISRLFRADFNAVLDHIEEPELLLRQSVREMEDELGNCERRIAGRKQEQLALEQRRRQLEGTLASMSEQLDLCFDAGKESLAKGLVRRKLETEYLLKEIAADYSVNEEFIAEQQSLLAENATTLEALRQKAELVERQKPLSSAPADVRRLASSAAIHDDEVEIAFLAEKTRRIAS